MRADAKTLLLASAVIACLAYLYWAEWRHRTGAAVGVRSSVDGMVYRVHEGLTGGASEAADAIARLNATSLDLIEWFDRRHNRPGTLAAWGRTLPFSDPRRAAALDPARTNRIAGPPGSPSRAAMAKNMLERYDPDALVENSPNAPPGETSYVVGKGAEFALCLRDRDGHGLIENMHLVGFVKLHELTHVAVDVQQHPPEFWQAFKSVLQEAAAAGLHSPFDYRLQPADYCGLHVDYNPFYDNGLTAA